MRVVLIGGTGLVGTLLVPRLLASGHEVHALQRRASAPGGSGGYRPHVAAPAQWPALVREIAPEAAVSALGTTLRKAGSQAAFRAVDHDLVAALALAFASAGARRMVAVSSVGADPGSSNFYLRIKGEMEEALVDLGFARLDILRPGLLRGRRGGDRRPGERIAVALSPLVNLALRGRLDRFAAIEAGTVAAAIVGALRQDGAGIHRHENRAIRQLAEAASDSADIRRQSTETHRR